MATYVPCKKNDSNGYVTYVSLRSQANMAIMQVSPTLVAGDVKIAIDDGAPANLGTLPVVDADFTTRVKVTLSQAETNGDNLTIVFLDATGAEWCDLTINIQTSVQTLDELKTLVDTIDTVADAIKAVTDLLPNAGALSDLATILTDTGELQTDWADGGRLDLLIDAITTYVDLIDDATNGLAAIKAEVEGLAGAAMRGTDNAATEAKQDIIDTVVDGIQTDLSNATDGLGALKTLIDAIDAVLTTMKQVAAGTFNRETDSLQAIRDRGDAAWTTGAGGTAPTVEEIDTELTTEHGSGSWVGLTAIEFEED